MEKNKLHAAGRPQTSSPRSGSPRNGLDRVARTLKVCGHPVRLKLLQAIESRAPCVSDLWRCVNETQPVVSQHLAVLKREKIVASRVEGNRRIYSVIDPWVRDLISRIP